MKYLRILYHLMRADLFERARRYGFLITLGLVIFVAYLWVPPKEADYLTQSVGPHRGVYNSAWIGASMAMLCSMMLSLPAFYLVKNAVGRDERTRVGQIIATTPLSKPTYTLGKAFSNFVFLTLMVGVVALAGAVMQLVRGEVLRIDPWPLLSPFVFCVLPAMAMIAALAVLFETLPGLRGTLGNVVYFALWMSIVGTSAMAWPSPSQPIAKPANDPLGTSVIVSGMVKDTVAAFPGYTGGDTGVGVFPLSAPLETFPWAGIDWTAGIILGRLMWFAGAIGLGLAAAIFFRRFDTAPQRLGRRHQVNGTAAPDLHELEHERASEPAERIQLTPLAAGFHPRPVALIVAELRLMLKGTSLWWYLVALGLIAAGVLLPDDYARYAFPAAWLWPLALWSSLGCREARHDAAKLVFSAPRLMGRQLPALWLAGIVVTLLTGLGFAARFALAGDWMRLLAWGTGALFIPALALALGAWSRSTMLFEVVYVVWWYMGTIQGVPALDFMGAGGQAGMEIMPIYWSAIVILLALAVLGRRQQLRMG